MTFCNDCGASIEWHETAAGRKMPVDAEPVLPGPEAAKLARSLYYFDRTVRLVSVLRLLPEDPTPKRMYRSHFDTCKNRRPQAPVYTCSNCDGPSVRRGGTWQCARDCDAQGDED